MRDGRFAYSIRPARFPAVKKAVRSLTGRKPDTDSDWVKTRCSNLIRYRPNGTYFGNVRVNDKSILRSHGTQQRSNAISSIVRDEAFAFSITKPAAQTVGLFSVASLRSTRTGRLGLRRCFVALGFES